MDKIIVLIIVLINILTIADAQLYCFVCTNCPEANDLDASFAQACDSLPPSNTPPTVTPPNTPPTATVEISVSPDFEYSTVDIDPSTVTVTTEIATPPTVEIDPTTSDPNQPTSALPSIPTTTTQVPSPPPNFAKYGIVGIQFTGAHQCFRVERRVGNDIEVNRGCVAVANTPHETCIRANFGVTPIGCRICPFNQCNKATSYTTSLNVIFSGIVAIVAITILR